MLASAYEGDRQSSITQRSAGKIGVNRILFFLFSFQTLLKGTFSLLTYHMQFSITARVSMTLKRQSAQSLSDHKTEGANGGTQFSDNYYFFGQILVNYTIFLANSQLTTYFGWLLAFIFPQRILFLHNPNFSSFSKSITFGGRS